MRKPADLDPVMLAAFSDAGLAHGMEGGQGFNSPQLH
jgi:hypothetical protein